MWCRRGDVSLTPLGYSTGSFTGKISYIICFLYPASWFSLYLAAILTLPLCVCMFISRIHLSPYCDCFQGDMYVWRTVQGFSQLSLGYLLEIRCQEYIWWWYLKIKLDIPRNRNDMTLEPVSDTVMVWIRHQKAEAASQQNRGIVANIFPG